MIACLTDKNMSELTVADDRDKRMFAEKRFQNAVQHNRLWLFNLTAG